MIAGESTSVFNAYTWNGSAWNTNATLASGLGGVATRTAPTVYYDGATLKLISGSDTDGFYGYLWTGSAWSRNDGATVTGLSDAVLRGTPEVYNYYGTLKFISGDIGGQFPSALAYYWNGSSWISDSTIITGLPDVGEESTIGILVDGNTFHAFLGDDAGELEVYSQLFSPYLTSPTNTSTISGTFPPISYDVTFTWENNWDSFRYQVARDAAFNVLAADGYVSTNTVTVALTDDYYYWRVAAYDSINDVQSDYSDVWEFDLNLTAAGITETAIDGVVYEVTDEGDIAVDEAIVYIYNNTWSSQQITGTNGYYQLVGLAAGEIYSVQATKQGYIDSNVELVNTTSGQATTKNILIERRTGAGDQYDFHYVKYTLKNILDTRYSNVDVEVFENGDIVALYSAETGTDGSVTFILNRDQEYRLEFTNTTQGIDEEIIHYPKNDHYNVYITTSLIPEDTSKESDNIDITISKSTINNTHAYINVSYIDSLEETSNLYFYVNQSDSTDPFNQTNIDSYSNASTSNISHSFIITPYSGQTFVVNINADHTTYNSIDYSFSVRFEGQAEDHGFSNVWIWLSVAAILFTGLLFKATKATQGALVVCGIAWIFVLLDWFDNLGDKGVLAITAGLTLASVLAIVANMSKRRKED